MNNYKKNFIKMTRYIVFLFKEAESMLPKNFATFEEAWECAKQEVLAYNTNTGTNMMVMLHATAAECKATKASGHADVNQWVYGNYSGSKSSETRFALGDARIIEVNF